MDVPSFYEAKMLEQQQRHLKYHDTAYNLEPNVKESPAGCATCRRCCGSPARRGSADWRELAEAGLITPQEARRCRGRSGCIGALRVRLHYLAGRREDRLVFDLQSALARELGLADTPARRASEQLMQRYYRAAKIGAAGQRDPAAEPARAAVPSRREPLAIDGDFQAIDELLDVRDEALFERGPAAMLDAFLTHAAPPGAEGHVGAHAARAMAQPASGRRRASAAIRRTARDSSRCCASRAASRTSCAG